MAVSVLGSAAIESVEQAGASQIGRCGALGSRPKRFWSGRTLLGTWDGPPSQDSAVVLTVQDY